MLPQPSPSPTFGVCALLVLVPTLLTAVHTNKPPPPPPPNTHSTPVAVDSKSDASPVTIADREAETAMRSLLAQLVPDHGVFGEEAGYTAGTSDEYVWVLDPIDGTKSFITGTPWWMLESACLRDCAADTIDYVWQ